MRVKRTEEPPLLKFATRGSALALAQVQAVVSRLTRIHPDWRTETVVVATQGDIDKVSPLTEIGGRGVFTNALERELAHGLVDAAIHSAKDLPSQISSVLPLAAFPEREDPRDVLVSRHELGLAALPPNPVIGTSSRRREAQIRRLRPDARIVSLRGNIDTRLRKSLEPAYDGIVVAAAGLHRMGWASRITEYFPVDVVVPSPGQGALAIQTTAISPARALMIELDDVHVSRVVQVERTFLASVGAGCTLPVGAHIEYQGDELLLTAFLEAESGARYARRQVLLDSSDPIGHTEAIAQEMRSIVDKSDCALWSLLPAAPRDLTGVRVAVTRPRKQAQQLMRELANRGAIPLALPAIRIEPPQDQAPLKAAMRSLAAGAFTWVVFTSANAVDAVAGAATELGARDQCLRAIRVAAVGDATARAAHDLGLDVALVAAVPTAEGLVDTLLSRVQAGERLLYPRSAIGRDVLPAALREAGIEISVVDAYRTVPEERIDSDVLARLRASEVDALLFSAPSTVSSLISLLGTERNLIDQIPAICAGPVTAAAVREAGLCLAAVSAHPGAEALVDTLAECWAAQAEARGHLASGDRDARHSERTTGR